MRVSCVGWLLCALVIVVCGSASGAVPQLMSYQGLLRGLDGTPVADGDYDVTIRIYRDSLATSLAWEETQTATTANGVFHVLLGAVDTIPHAAFAGDAYIGTAIDGGPEMQPLVRIVSVGYAFEAFNAQRLAGVPVSDLEESGEIATTVEAFGDSLAQAPFRNLFRSTTTFNSSGEAVAFAVGPAVTRYISGIYLRVDGSQIPPRSLQVKVDGAVVLVITANPDGGGDGFWNSAGGAPLMIAPGETVSLNPNGAGTYTVLITGYEF